MAKNKKQLWEGLTAEARNALVMRDYTRPKAGEEPIPGVEIFPRKINHQRHRGVFGEFVRRDEGVLQRIGFWPAQWATARMFAQTAKGFHVHPPNIPKGTKAEDWMRRLFVKEPKNFALRRYAKEQWDVMFFVQG